MAHHLAEEDNNFLTMRRTAEHPSTRLDVRDIDDFGDPLSILIAREDAAARHRLANAKIMTLRNQKPRQ